jgi:hypothetical protein
LVFDQVIRNRKAIMSKNKNTNAIDEAPDAVTSMNDVHIKSNRKAVRNVRYRVSILNHRLTRSRSKYEREWGAGYRIFDQNNFLVAGFYGYGLNPEEVMKWCDEQ